MYQLCQRFIAVACLVFALQAKANTVVGNFEGVYWKSTTYAMDGWACVYGVSSSVDLHVYVGAPWPNGTMIAAGRADVVAEPGVSAACASSSNRHRFSVPVSSALLKQHAGKPLYIYAQLASHGVSSLVPGSGNVALPSVPYNGYVKGNSEGIYWGGDGYYLMGWACAYGINQSVELNIYAGGPYTSGTMIYTGVANAVSESGVGSACGTTLGRHRFSVRLSDAVLAQHQGQPLYVYAILPSYGVNDPVPGTPTVPTVATVAAPTFSPVGGSFNNAVSVTLASATSQAQVYYTLNGSTPTCGGSTLYTSPLQLSSTTTVSAIACKAGMTPSTTRSAQYTFAAAPPQFSPPGGTYNSALSVSLSSTTSGAALYYTLDGSAPACGSPSVAYGAPFALSQTTTVRAISCRSGFATSAPVSATYTFSTSNWSGPTATIVTVGGGKRIAVNGQPVSPLHFAFNLQSCKSLNCVNEDAFVDDQLGELARTQAFGTRPVIEVANLGYRGEGAVQRLGERLKKARDTYPGFDPYIIVRFDLYDANESAIGCTPGENYLSSAYVPLFNNLGQRYDANTLCASADPSADPPYVMKPYKRFTEAWIDSRKAEISTLAELLEANAETRGRVIGMSFTYMIAGEFFFSPFNGSGKDVKGEVPWEPLHASKFFYSDYSSTPGASVSSRMTENAGIFLAGSTKVAALQASRDEVATLVSTISKLAAKVKDATGGKALTKVFYGYSYGFSARRAAAVHHGLATLLLDPNVDILASPYSYYLARRLGFGFDPQISVDSIARAGKLFHYEDDTRTHLAAADDWRHVNTVSETNRLLVRNGISAAIHGAGLYYFDLPAQGWFGTRNNRPDTESIWSTIKNTSTVASSVVTSGSAYAPQIAVFVDEKSVPNYPLDGLGGSAAYPFGNAIATGQLEALSRIGAPVRHYILSDLASLDVSNIRMAVFLDAFKLSEADRVLIKQKLGTQGRTLLYLYAPGFIDGGDNAAEANISSFLGMPVVRRTAVSSFSAASYVNGQAYPDDSAGTPMQMGNFEHQYRIAVGSAGGEPCPDATAVNCIDTGMRSNYVGSGDVAFAVKRVSDGNGSHKAAYSAVPGVPTSMLRDMAIDAGVHIFSCSSGGSCSDAVVEASDNTLMLHTVGPLPTLSMPLARTGCAFSVSEWAGMTTSSSPSLVPVSCPGNQCQVNVGESQGVRVYRLTPGC